MHTFNSGLSLVRATRIMVLGSAAILLPHLCSAQTRPMPAINAKTLSGNLVQLPGPAKGRPVVLVFGFARSAKGEGEVWGRKLIELQRERNDFDFFQVAPISDAPHFAQGLITRAIRAAVPSAYYPHMLLLTQNDKAWRDLLDVTDEGTAYALLCSSTGAIEWQGSGVGQAQFDALQARLMKYAE